MLSNRFFLIWIIQLHVSLQLIVDLCTQGYLSDKASLQMQIKNTTDVYKDDIPTFNAEHKAHVHFREMILKSHTNVTWNIRA